MAIDFTRMTPDEAAKFKSYFVPDHKPQQGRGMNKTEQAFEEALNILAVSQTIRRGVRNYKTFPLAGNTTYVPDFHVIDMNEIDWLIEIKGFMRDDAAVKLKVAAAMYPEYRWLLAKRIKGQWKCYEVTAEKGIGRKAISVEWMGQ